MAEQRTPEWYAERLGKVTASRVFDAIARTKGRQTKTKGLVPGKYTEARAKYMRDLITERLTGNVTEIYVSRRMQRGIELEDAARAAYEWHTGAELVEPSPYVPHPTIVDAGASPDRLVGDDGLLEIKCPDPGTQVDVWLADEVEDQYLAQMMWQLACTGRQWCDFASYDPRLPEHLSLYVKRIERDDARISEMESEVRKFLAELEAKIARLNGNEEAA